MKKYLPFLLIWFLSTGCSDVTGTDAEETMDWVQVSEKVEVIWPAIGDYVIHQDATVLKVYVSFPFETIPAEYRQGKLNVHVDVFLDGKYGGTVVSHGSVDVNRFWYPIVVGVRPDLANANTVRVKVDIEWLVEEMQFILSSHDYEFDGQLNLRNDLNALEIADVTFKME